MYVCDMYMFLWSCTCRGHLSPSPSALLFETGTLSELGAHSFSWLAGLPRSSKDLLSPLPSARVVDMCAIAPGIFSC